MADAETTELAGEAVCPSGLESPHHADFIGDFNLDPPIDQG